MRVPQTRFLVAAAGVAIALTWITFYTLKGRAKVKAYATMSYMGQIGNMLQIERPTQVSQEYIRGMLEKYDRISYFHDDWGNPFEFHVEHDRMGRFHYSIRSFGRDGKPGACCSNDPSEDWDRDAVLADGQWLQRWHT